MINFIRNNDKITKVLSLNAEYNDTRIVITAECVTTYGNEVFTIAKIFKDWKCQGNYTYFNGTDSEKEYKTVQPVLSAIDKWVLNINGNNDIFYYNKDEILIYTGLKKDPENTRRYKQFKKKIEAEKVETIKEIKEDNNNSIEVSETVENKINTNKIIRTIKMYNGELRNFSSNEEWEKLQDENWQMFLDAQSKKENELNLLKDKIKTYVNNLNNKSIHNISLVYNKLDQDIQNNNTFIIAIDKGYIINHECININDIPLN